jgi:hypothetical protein
MPWETRERGGYYYTRSRKANGRTIREYVGTGPLAELEAQKDALERLKRRLAALDLRDLKAELAALAARLDELDDLADLAARAALLAAGFHQHDRGAWRRRREQDD